VKIALIGRPERVIDRDQVVIATLIVEGYPVLDGASWSMCRA